MKWTIPFAQVATLKDRQDADRLLIRARPSLDPFNCDYEVISFASRIALEAFNKKADLKAVVLTQVPLNCAIYRHQSDADARAQLRKQCATLGGAV